MNEQEDYELELSPNITLIVKKPKVKHSSVSKRIAVKRCSDTQDWVENETNQAYKKAPKGNY